MICAKKQFFVHTLATMVCRTVVSGFAIAIPERLALLIGNANDNGKSFGTTSSLANIHSHYMGGEMDAALAYEFTGWMMISEPAGGFGVTFFIIIIRLLKFNFLQICYIFNRFIILED